jgi:hypothetical protein
VADGAARRGDPASLRAALRALTPSTTRLDLGQRRAGRGRGALHRGASRARSSVITDLQATALGAATTRAPVTVARPEGEVPRNIGVAGFVAGSQPWSTDGGQVQVTVTGDSAAQAPLQLTAGDRPRATGARHRRSVPCQVAVPAAPPDGTPCAPRSSPTSCGSTTSVCSACAWPRSRAHRVRPQGRFAEAACDVLRSNGRLLPGDDVVLAGLWPGSRR